MPWREEHFDRAEASSSALLRSDTDIATPCITMTLWPNRSTKPAGLRIVLVIVASGFALPLLALMGNPVGWGLLPFFIFVLAALYLAMTRNYRDGRLNEVLQLWPDLIKVERTEPQGQKQLWQANPYWTKPELHKNARIENYLTLSGAGRIVELGAFLSPEERLDLFDALVRAMNAVRNR